MWRIKNHKKGKHSLHSKEDFAENLQSMNLNPCFKKLKPKYQEVFGTLFPPLSCKKLVQLDLKLNTEF